MVNQLPPSPLTRAVNLVNSWNVTKESIILKSWVIQTMLLSTFMTHILARLNLTVKLSTRPQSTLRWLPMMDSLNHLLPTFLSLQSLSKIILMSFIMFGAWATIALKETMSYMKNVRMKENFSYAFLLTGLILLLVLTL